MRFEGGSSVTVIGVLPDELVGAAEVVVNRATGGTIGVTQNRYLLFQPSAGLQPSSQQLEKRFRAVLPPGLPYPVVQVRAPGETTYLRADDDTLPPALVKRRFGEWAGRRRSATEIEVDPTWVQDHIVTVTIPVLGRVACNERLLPQLRGAMKDLVAQGLESTIHSFDGCFVGTVRSVVAVGCDLAQRLGRRHRRQRRHEPDRLPARAGSRTRGRDGGVGLRRGEAT